MRDLTADIGWYWHYRSRLTTRKRRGNGRLQAQRRHDESKVNHENIIYNLDKTHMFYATWWHRMMLRKGRTYGAGFPK